MPADGLYTRKDSPCLYGRFTYLGVRVDQSTRVTTRPLARKIIRKWKDEIERGVFAKADAPTFAGAVLGYLNAGGDRRPTSKLLEYFIEPDGKSTPLDQIDQAAIDKCAAELFPTHSAATRNREVYSPISAILKQAGHDFRIRRPKGSRGRELTGWLWPEEAERLLNAASALDLEFGIFCRMLCYTGLRLREATLHFKCENLSLADSYALILKTKNRKPRSVHLPPHLVVALANHPRGLDRPGERVFRFQKGGRLYAMLDAAAKSAGVTLQDREAFHTFRHTYGAWMRRYGGADTKGLVGTGAWDSEQAASRYAHAVASEEAKRADMLPAGKASAK
jgi:integrase